VSGQLRSGQLAAAAGVNPQTLRHYERRGLLAEPDRSLGGHRLYPPEAVTALRVTMSGGYVPAGRGQPPSSRPR
jgi:MerR family transcriptional regulator, mercuric resistance operon regulatory protein